MSACYLRAIGENFGPSAGFARKAVHLDLGDTISDGYGIPYSFATKSTPKVPVTYGTDDCDYSDESDPGPYPISTSATIEGSTGNQGNIPPPDSDGGDRHLISLDTDNCMLYETYFTTFISGTNAASGVQTCASSVFNLSQHLPSRPLFYTSADAAGMPIFPGLLKYDEAISSAGIQHATRFTIERAQAAFTSPASHLGPSSNTNTSYTPYGARFRLKSTIDESLYTDPAALALVKAWKKYGLIFADQGSTMYVSGTSDTRWTNAIDQINSQNKLYHDDFEVVQIHSAITRDSSWNPAKPTCYGVSANTNPSWQPSPAQPCTGSTTQVFTTGTGGSGSSSTAAATSKASVSTTTSSATRAAAATSSSSAHAATSSTSSNQAPLTSSASSTSPTANPVASSSAAATVSTTTTSKRSSTTTTTSASASSTTSSASASATSTTSKPSTTTTSSSSSATPTTSTSATPKPSSTSTTSRSPSPSPTSPSTPLPTSPSTSSPTSPSTPAPSSSPSTPSPSASSSDSLEVNSSDSAYLFPSLAVLVALLAFKLL